jgi:hypothetical protein
MQYSTQHDANVRVVIDHLADAELPPDVSEAVEFLRGWLAKREKRLAEQEKAWAQQEAALARWDEERGIGIRQD